VRKPFDFADFVAAVQERLPADEDEDEEDGAGGSPTV
jgi:hypothetical protein